MKRIFSTCTVFVIGVFISYFLSDRFNDVTNQRRVDFTRAESETLFSEISLELKNDERGNMFTSVMKTYRFSPASDRTYRRGNRRKS